MPQQSLNSVFIALKTVGDHILTYIFNKNEDKKRHDEMFKSFFYEMSLKNFPVSRLSLDKK